jgi:hypothetical protein
MIPEFDLHGNLPKGIHKVTEAEFFDRFAASSPDANGLATGSET